MGWTVPESLISCLHAWLDPENRSKSEKDKKETNASEVEDANIKDEGTIHAQDSDDAKAKTPFKLDADYKINKGLNPYLTKFDNIVKVLVDYSNDDNGQKKEEEIKKKEKAF